jgi:hypothetical protein
MHNNFEEGKLSKYDFNVRRLEENLNLGTFLSGKNIGKYYKKRKQWK